MSTAGLLLSLTAMTAAQTDKAALKAKLEDQAGARWVYDDLAKGFDQARASGKPLLIVLRCTR